MKRQRVSGENPSFPPPCTKEEETSAAATVLSYTDLIYVHVALPFLGLADRSRLGRVSRALYTKFMQQDASLQFMRSLYAVPRMRNKRRRQLVRESGLPLCVQWLWHRTVTPDNVSDETKVFIKAVAIHGTRELVDFVMDKASSNLRTAMPFVKVFLILNLTKHGHETEAWRVFQEQAPALVGDTVDMCYNASVVFGCYVLEERLRALLLAGVEDHHGFYLFRLRKALESYNRSPAPFERFWNESPERVQRDFFMQGHAMRSVMSVIQTPTRKSFGIVRLLVRVASPLFDPLPEWLARLQEINGAVP